jgi:hypothetical protein
MEVDLYVAITIPAQYRQLIQMIFAILFLGKKEGMLGTNAIGVPVSGHYGRIVAHPGIDPGAFLFVRYSVGPWLVVIGHTQHDVNEGALPLWPAPQSQQIRPDPDVEPPAPQQQRNHRNKQSGRQICH